MLCRLRPSLPVSTAAALALGLQLVVSSAAAHIELQLPLNRYSDVRRGANEACPCGSGTTSRRCNDPAERSDDNRALERVTTFAPGDTITVRFSEYVGHDGRYRIAIDPDGADLSDFNQHILLDEPDPRGAAGNIGEGTTWEFQVTLPDITCDNCTLQLIQVIDGNTTAPVLDPATRGDTYFQCADIILVEGTPPGGIGPVDPGQHLAELRRPGRAPALPDEMPDTSEQGAGPVMGTAADGTGSTSAVPAAQDGRRTSSAGGGEGACSLTFGCASRHGLPAFCLLAAALTGLLARRRRPGSTTAPPCHGRPGSPG